MTLLIQQILLEEKYSKYQLISTLKEDFATLLEDDRSDDFMLEVLVHIYLHRQADPATMVGILSPKYGTAQQVADRLAEAVKGDVLDFDMTANKFIVIYNAEPETEELINKYQYPLPMVMKPLSVTKNNETGYFNITNNLVLNGSTIDRNSDDATYFIDKPLSLDHINRMNAVPLSLDMALVNEFELPTPKRKIGESFTDFDKKVRQQAVFFSESKYVMQELSDITDTIYLTHRYDRRGRCYASGYHINYQGDDLHKAVVQLAKKELVQ